MMTARLNLSSSVITTNDTKCVGLSPVRPVATLARRSFTAQLPPRVLLASRVCRDLSNSAAAGAELPTPEEEPQAQPEAASSTSSNGVVGWWKQQQAKSVELRSKLGSLGLSAVLAYGRRVFSGVLCMLQDTPTGLHMLLCCPHATYHVVLHPRLQPPNPFILSNPHPLPLQACLMG
jgi:hypothetical protein